MAAKPELFPSGMILLVPSVIVEAAAADPLRDRETLPVPNEAGNSLEMGGPYMEERGGWQRRQTGGRPEIALIARQDPTRPQQESAMLQRILLLGAVLLAVPAAAPAGHADTPTADRGDGLTVLHLAETADRMVKRDRIRVDLRAEATGPDARRVQAEINKRMTAALERARAVPSVKPETRGYSVYEERPQNAPARWRGSQTLSLVGRDPGELLALAGELQGDGMAMSGMSYDVAPETARSLQDDLTGEALVRLKQRAEAIAASLDLGIVRYREIRVGNVDGGRPPPVPMRAMLAQGSAPMPPPAAEAGDATVQVTVDADVVLAPLEANRP
jgi:uncharacterized protein